MPSFNIVKEINPSTTFRVESVKSSFDLQVEKIVETFSGNIDIENKEWNIGLIVGSSGSGKTSIARDCFGDYIVADFNYESNSVIDDMPKQKSVSEITKAFTSVGFASPPSWLKPYNVLSNGEKMRVDLARAILQENDLIVFDEFTSVVDRQVAKTGSYAVSKAVKKLNKKFIAISCHYDIKEWLEPDWIYDTNEKRFFFCSIQRPKIKIEIVETKDKSIWERFKKYHYLSSAHNNSARVFLAFVNNELAGFCSVLHFAHPIEKRFKKIHRLVVMPNYQGIGVGMTLLNEVALYFKKINNRVIITTSTKALVFALKKSKLWRLKRSGRTKNTKRGSTRKSYDASISKTRNTTSWEYHNLTIF